MDGKEYNISSCLSADRLEDADRDILQKLINVHQDKLANNKKRLAYYRDKVPVRNIGIAVDKKIQRKISTDVGWAAKAVDMLAERSVFDSFVVKGNTDDNVLTEIMHANDIGYSYELALPSELIYSVGFWTVTKGEKYPIIRYYNAENGAALWDWDKRRILAGFVITDYEYMNTNYYVPKCVVMHTSDAMVILTRDDSYWTAERKPHNIGRPLMEAMCFKPSDDRPFGKSVISKTCISIIDEMKRELLRSSLHSELFTSPAKYVTGVSNIDPDDEDKASEQVMAIKRLFKMNDVFVGERDADGNSPTIGQLAASSMQPHNEAMQTLAKRMASEASIPLNSLGIIHDNPSSAEALRASMEDLTVKAEKLNRTNAKALKNVAKLALAVHQNKSFDMLSEEESAIDVCWKNPSQPSMASVADAMMKQASVLSWLPETDVFLECLGYSDSQRARLNSDKRRIQAEQRMNNQLKPIPQDNKENEDEAVNGNAE